MSVDQKLDLCGLSCPLPILRAKKALAKMQSGELIHILVTDPNAPKDLADFCLKSGNNLISSENISENKFCVTLSRK